MAQFQIVKNADNPDYVDRLIQMLPNGAHGLARNEDTTPIESGGNWVVESDDPDFCQFAGVKLGIFTLAQ